MVKCGTTTCGRAPAIVKRAPSSLVGDRYTGAGREHDPVVSSVVAVSKTVLSQTSVMLCYAMLCYAMLCYAMLCYVMLCNSGCFYLYVDGLIVRPEFSAFPSGSCFGEMVL